MQKVLITVHLGRHFRIFGHYDLQVLAKMGFEVHIASNFKGTLDQFSWPGITMHQVDFVRNPFSLKNLRALKQLICLLNEHDFDFVHTQSPAGGALTRLACMVRKSGKHPVVYTAHGFHFYKGAPFRNWLVYFPIEKILSFITDRIITINEEDYKAAKSLLNSPAVNLISGVGVDLDKYAPVDFLQKKILRENYGYDLNAFLILCIGELNSVKRQDFLIKALAKLSGSIQGIHLLLAGTGEKLCEFEKLALELGVSNQVHFLGYRKDISKLLGLVDVVASSSSREGLPLNILEAMAAGLPVIASDSRGNRDLVKNEENGFLVEFGDTMAFASAFECLYKNPDLRFRMGKKSHEMVRRFSIENVEQEMRQIYNEILSHRKIRNKNGVTND